MKKLSAPRNHLKTIKPKPLSKHHPIGNLGKYAHPPKAKTPKK